VTKFATALSDSFVKGYEGKIPPWSEVGYITFKRTYARMLEDKGRTEEWHETCARVVNGLLEINGQFTKPETEELFDHLFNLRGSTSGRALWQLGSDTVRKIGADSLQNCWLVTCDDLSAFTFTMNQLMLGGGVGFNIEPCYVYALPVVRHNPIVERVESPDCDYIVRDNREGWVELLEKVLDSYFVTGKPLRYYTKCVREKGKLIKSFGGTASGSEILVEGIEKIVAILASRQHYKLRPIDCMDIMNIIGSIVVAGNVRRSSEIAIGDAHDLAFLHAKNWKRGTYPNWRQMSNNTVAADEIVDVPDDYWELFDGCGEPYGLINLKNCRRFGRLADGLDYRPDFLVAGANPCAEITLENHEPCNLAEQFLHRLETQQQWLSVAGLLYKACKTISCVKFSDPVTDEVVKRNRRLGIGVTGYQASKWRGNADAFTTVYRYLEELDQEYSKQLGVSCSRKLTTVKPSGTLSLLPYGCPPGQHAAYSQYLIRRIRFSADDPLVEVCREHGYHVEPLRKVDKTPDMGTMVVSFPMSFPRSVVTADTQSVIDTLEVQKFLQTYWADNSVSATHYFNKKEIPDIKAWLAENYSDHVKTCSFLLYQGHGFDQAPLEPIDKEQYQQLKKSTRPITSFLDDAQRDHLDNLECAGGSCPVK
jgi:ribonucleoside-triphosphate reductase